MPRASSRSSQRARVSAWLREQPAAGLFPGLVNPLALASLDSGQALLELAPVGLEVALELGQLLLGPFAYGAVFPVLHHCIELRWVGTAELLQLGPDALGVRRGGRELILQLLLQVAGRPLLQLAQVLQLLLVLLEQLQVVQLGVQVLRLLFLQAGLMIQSVTLELLCLRKILIEFLSRGGLLRCFVLNVLDSFLGLLLVNFRPFDGRAGLERLEHTILLISC